mgnify:CR=1 FL=1
MLTSLRLCHVFGWTVFSLCEKHFKSSDYIFTCISWSNHSINISSCCCGFYIGLESLYTAAFSLRTAASSPGYIDLGCKRGIHHTDFCIIPCVYKIRTYGFAVHCNVSSSICFTDYNVYLRNSCICKCMDHFSNCFGNHFFHCRELL